VPEGEIDGHQHALPARCAAWRGKLRERFDLWYTVSPRRASQDWIQAQESRRRYRWTMSGSRQRIAKDVLTVDQRIRSGAFNVSARHSGGKELADAGEGALEARNTPAMLFQLEDNSRAYASWLRDCSTDSKSGWVPIASASRSRASCSSGATARQAATSSHARACLPDPADGGDLDVADRRSPVQTVTSPFANLKHREAVQCWRRSCASASNGDAEGVGLLKYAIMAF
jgi:hypothetical protein